MTEISAPPDSSAGVPRGTAILTFHLPNGFYFGANGFEYQFFLTVAALAVAVTGPGAYALGRRKTS